MSPDHYAAFTITEGFPRVSGDEPVGVQGCDVVVVVFPA